MATRSSRESELRLPRQSDDVLSDAARTCLSPDDVLALLGEPFKPAAPGLAHIETCVRCRILVAESLRPSGWVQTDAKQSLDVLQPRRNAGLTTFRVGDLVADRFVTRRFLARGGMGEVYLVFDRLLEEEVALKTLPCSALDDSEAVRSVKAEVQMARRIADRHVCRILDFGVHHIHPKAALPGQGSAVPFLTMAYLQGETLGSRVRSRGGLSLEELVKYGREIALGLAAIHEAGVVHRDVKSDNVFLTRAQDDEVESAVVMDLGLAGLMSERVSSPRIMGTQGYMSPQQLAGAGERDPRDDVFSMGKVLQEMALGHVRTLNPSEVISAFCERFGDNSGARSAAKVTVICQAAERDERYATARLAALELGKIMEIASAKHLPSWLLRWPLVALGLFLGAALLWHTRSNVAPRGSASSARSPNPVAAKKSTPQRQSPRQSEALASAASLDASARIDERLAGLRKQRTKATPSHSPAPAPAREQKSRATPGIDLASPQPAHAGTERPHPNQLYDPRRLEAMPD